MNAREQPLIATGRLTVRPPRIADHAEQWAAELWQQPQPGIAEATFVACVADAADAHAICDAINVSAELEELCRQVIGWHDGDIEAPFLHATVRRLKEVLGRPHPPTG